MRQRQLRWPVPAELEATLPGRAIRDVGRRAKYLLLETAPAGTVLLHLGLDSRRRAVRRELQAVARERGVHPVAIAWILRHSAEIQPILGGRTPSEIHEAAQGIDLDLTRNEWYRLFNAARGAPVRQRASCRIAGVVVCLDAGVRRGRTSFRRR